MKLYRKRKSRNLLKNWDKDKSVTRQSSGSTGGFYGRTCRTLKVTQVCLTQGAPLTPQKLKTALHTDPMYQTPAIMVRVRGRMGANGDIISPVELTTPNGTYLTSVADMKQPDGIVRRLFQEEDDKENRQFSDPNYQPARLKVDSLEVPDPANLNSPAGSNYRKMVAKNVVYPPVISVKKTITSRTLKVAKKINRRKSASSVIGLPAALIRAYLTKRLYGVANLALADLSHLLANAHDGGYGTSGISSAHHNTLRLIILESIITKIVCQENCAVDFAAEANMIIDQQGKPTPLIKSEKNTITCKGQPVEMHFSDAQSDRATAHSLHYVAANLVFFSLFNKTVERQAPKAANANSLAP